ncbi:MAG TPA: uracil-DNA glycosylase [Alphaproteobacteria bacterium]|nr:uracil-DNA glycosylase [Alphaproteobacteria bacterium]
MAARPRTIRPITGPPDPGRDCPLCPRLAGYRQANRSAHPGFFNAPVPGLGPFDARLLIVGLAPGLKGANATGRPFVGDGAGALLFRTLCRLGLADGEEPLGCRITNAVRCLPPANRPTAAEVAACRPFLAGEMEAMPNLRVVVALGRIAHDAVLRALGLRPAPLPFAHGARHSLPDGRWLLDSYHCSRQNTNTGRLTPAMFEAVFAEARALLPDTALCRVPRIHPGRLLVD